MGDFTFSEHGEDILIHRLLLWKQSGVYVDCGAYHPTRMSLTARLRAFGWTGVDIDIDEAVVQTFRDRVPASTPVCAAVSDVQREVTFHRYEDPVLNTISDEQFQRLDRIEQAGELFTRHDGATTVTTRTLIEILGELALPNQSVDFLNLDIEGGELQALQGFPWSSQTPAVIAVEVHRLDLARCSEHEIVRFLVRQGYVLQSYVFHTAIFMRRDFDTELCHRVQFARL
jgi:FkbM family methyltransferase